MSKSFTRTIEDALQVALRRHPLRFSLEITPKSVCGLPCNVSSASVVWEKGSKVSYTDPSSVNPLNNTAAFCQVMKQTTTIYKQGNTLLPKRYTFKIKAMPPATSPAGSSSSTSSVPTPRSASSTRCRTIARATLDLAQFCSAEAAPGAAAVIELPLQPRGSLSLSIKTLWLQHYDAARAADESALQGVERSFACHWGSVSDLESATDVSSMTSSLHGSYLSLAGRDAAPTASAEIDALLREAETTTPAQPGSLSGKQAAPGPLTPQGCSLTQPRVLSLASISRVTSTGALQQPPLTASLAAAGAQRCSSQSGAALCTSGPCCHEVFVGSSCSSGSLYSGDSRGAGVWPCGSRKWHRRASSTPETPTIPELEQEGFDPTSAIEQVRPSHHSCSVGDATIQDAEQQVQQGHEVLPFGLKPHPAAAAAADGCSASGEDEEAEDSWDDSPAWPQPPAAAAAAAAVAGTGVLTDSSCKGFRSSHGPEGLRSLSGHMPSWLWPSSRLAVRDLTTEEIMRRINTSRDVSALQHIGRGLLCERNDWRFRATQAERTNAVLEEEVVRLKESEAATKAQLQQQGGDTQLVAALVEAKLQLAQGDLSMQELRGQLERERKRHKQALARLTSLQSSFDELINAQQAVGPAAACQPCREAPASCMLGS